MTDTTQALLEQLSTAETQQQLDLVQRKLEVLKAFQAPDTATE